MGMTRIGKEKIKAIDVEIFVNDEGMFVCDLDGEQLSAPTKIALTQKVMRYMSQKSAKIAVPFVAIKKGKIVHGVLTGIHGRTRNVLVRWADGRTDQHTYWSTESEFVKPDKGEEFLALTNAVKEAQEKLDKFIQRHGIKSRDAVLEALKEAGVEVEE